MDPLKMPVRPLHETETRYARIRPEIHLYARDIADGTRGLTLSHWVDWEMWDRVRDYFVELEEGDWFCYEAHAVAVEEALQILPENRWEARRVRQTAEPAHS